MDLSEEKTIFDSIGEGYVAGFVVVNMPGLGVPRFITFDDGAVLFHSVSVSKVIWHDVPGELIARLEHIRVVSNEEARVVLKFQETQKQVELSNPRHGVYWGR